MANASGPIRYNHWMRNSGLNAVVTLKQMRIRSGQQAHRSHLLPLRQLPPIGRRKQRTLPMRLQLRCFLYSKDIFHGTVSWLALECTAENLHGQQHANRPCHTNACMFGFLFQEVNPISRAENDVHVLSGARTRCCCGGCSGSSAVAGSDGRSGSGRLQQLAACPACPNQAHNQKVACIRLRF